MATVDGSGYEARRFQREKKNTQLNYMYATLGMEPDDSNDDDFVCDEDEDTGEEDDDHAGTQNSERLAEKVASHGRRKKLTSHPSKRKNVFSGVFAESEARLSSLPPPTEYQPRKRASKHLEELASLRNESDEIVNVVPPFKLSDGVQSWDEFNQELEEYKRKNHLKFRIRRSEKRHSTTRITHEDQMPTVFEWTHKIYRCTHGVTQGSRSKGHRNQQSRYNDCKARITAVVTRESGYTHKIVIRNENHTHSHPRGPTQTSSYLTTNAMPLDEQDREDVKTLADARVSSSHIARLLNDRIGCKVTPQQARNFIRSITGKESGEDQMDVTCGVVMQTKVQKLMFERWSETLAMDFTHGTNNRVYHLGSLVVTTATGRGFPVVDFICLNEQAATTSTVLEYFKEKNPRWKDVTTVVIDKDFVEWQVLEKCFPNTKNFLCQFHAISYWKKVMKRPAYRLKMSQREELLQMMTKLLY
ncbi:hypothetical protein L914_04779, partial [Phytophthora nicotianae]